MFSPSRHHHRAIKLHSALIALNAGMEGQTFGVRKFLGACQNEPKGFASAQRFSTQEANTDVANPTAIFDGTYIRSSSHILKGPTSMWKSIPRKFSHSSD
jgi:hypothetical protein